MTIECYYWWCPHHEFNKDPEDGPFCYEDECRVTEAQRAQYYSRHQEENYRLWLARTESDMVTGTYTGGRVELKGKTALLRKDRRPGFYLAQFDDLSLHFYAHGWTLFPECDFSVEADQGLQ
jgi:hypothetical protein